MTPTVVALGNEIRKGLLHAWSERIQILIELPMFAVFILLLGPTLGQGHQIATGHLHWSLQSGRTSVLVVWFVPFIFFYMQVVKTFWRLLGEIQTGTIEQVYLSPLPPGSSPQQAVCSPRWSRRSSSPRAPTASCASSSPSTSPGAWPPYQPRPK